MNGNCFYLFHSRNKNLSYSFFHSQKKRSDTCHTMYKWIENCVATIRVFERNANTSTKGRVKRQREIFLKYINNIHAWKMNSEKSEKEWNTLNSFVFWWHRTCNVTNFVDISTWLPRNKNKQTLCGMFENRNLF